ncbi:hypothetical protein [Streptomyces sp. SID11385]|uniref:hypothetical protein n=1 Tax=unclassified Streptomyces TaxID=2593676 RepID=UPI0013CCA6F2|nr:hypothetical protein [Streptomyces sp. SID11385]NEA42668.1 hypothetical protein [Streptomyces sp. SID11385]
MLDTSPFLSAVEQFADRLRAAPQSRLQRGAAARALALAQELATRAQKREEPGTEPRTMPDAGMFAVADQLTVTAHDLAQVLRDDAEVEHAAARVAEARGEAGL